jgi:hypothetical protein
MVFNKLNLNFNKEKVRCLVFAELPSPSCRTWCRSLLRTQLAKQMHGQLHKSHKVLASMLAAALLAGGLVAAAHQQQQQLQLLLTVQLTSVHDTSN